MQQFGGPVCINISSGTFQRYVIWLKSLQNEGVTIYLTFVISFILLAVRAWRVIIFKITQVFISRSSFRVYLLDILCVSVWLSAARF